MPYWLVFTLWVGSNLALAYIASRHRPDQPKASGLGDFQVPTVDASRVIPVVCGTVLLRGPNVAWYGDLKVFEETSSVPSGFLGFGSTKVVTGYSYYLGMQLALCQGPVDTFRAFWWDDRPLTTTTAALGDHLRVTLPGNSITVFSSTFPTRGSDPAGLVDFYYGSASQNPNDYLQAAVGASLPGYRTVCYAVLRQVYVGHSNFIKNIGIELSRFPNTLGLSGGKHIIATYDGNPACFLYDALVNQDWGCGRPSSEIDLASFQAAGNALYDEGLGMSAKWESAADADSIIEDVLRHIDGVMYKDPFTGLRVLKLARADYDPATIPVLDQDSVREIEFSRPSWSELSNTVQVRYVARADGYTQRVAEQQNLASIQVQGDRVVETLDFLAASRPEVANLLAARSLKGLSYPLARCTLYVNRKAWNLTPGSVFKLNWPALGISGLILRVTHPNYGEIESPEITIESVEDAFAIASTAFSAPPASGWVTPVVPPAAAVAERLIEGPYHLVGSADRVAVAAAVRASGTDVGYQVWSDRLGGSAFVQTNPVGGFAPSGLLTAAYPVNTAALDVTGFTIDGGTDLQLLRSISDDELATGVNLALIDSELVGFRDVTDNGDGTFTIGRVLRGLLDTVPAAHADNTRVYFLAPAGATPVEPLAPYPADGTVTARLLPYNSRSVFPFASASTLSLTTASRAQLPYPPGKVQVAGSTYPATIPAGVDAAVTWAHRHRVTQLADRRVVAQDAVSYVATPEGNYTIEVRVGGTLKRTVTALTGTSWTWTAAFQSADAASVGASVSIRIIPVNGSLVGTYQERLFTMA